MALSAFATVNEDVNHTGRVALYDLPDSVRYRRVSSQDLANEYLIADISSAHLYSAMGGCALVMVSSGWFVSDYEGRFLQMSAVGAGASVVVDDFRAQGFDNATSSMLLIGTHRGPETRLSFREIFLDKWKEFLQGELAGSDVSAHGDPILTWKMFPPSSIVPLDSDLTYLHVFQALDVLVRVGPLVTYHYDAGIGYYIFLYVDVRKHLKAFVAGYEVWVQSGFYHDAVYSVLQLKVAAGVATLNNRLTVELAPFSGIPLADIYYLPGNQTTSVSSILVGDTDDDVTIVLQRD